MLRHPDASSPIQDFAEPRFLPLVPDREVQDAKRILLASGKVGHELRAERRRRKDTETAIFFLDQFYPLPRLDLTAAIAAHPNAREIVWVQEEPRNMGAFLLHGAAARTPGERTRIAGALRKAFQQRQSRDRFGQGPRAGTKNAADAGVHYVTLPN